jgi:DNA-binding MarR family transcriptional regulator
MQDMDQALQAFYFAHRAIVAKPDAILARYGLCRVHHRILYFVGRNPGLSVNDLLAILGVSKQSVNAPMRKLMQAGLIVSAQDPADKRIKRLSLSTVGETLERELTEDQRDRLQKAFAAIGDAGKAAWFETMQLIAQA